MTYNIEIIITMTRWTRYERAEERILYPASCITPVPEMFEAARSQEHLLLEDFLRAGLPGLPVGGQEATVMI